MNTQTLQEKKELAEIESLFILDSVIPWGTPGKYIIRSKRNNPCFTNVDMEKLITLGYMIQSIHSENNCPELIVVRKP